LDEQVDIGEMKEGPWMRVRRVRKIRNRSRWEGASGNRIAEKKDKKTKRKKKEKRLKKKNKKRNKCLTVS
jgi:hypothetical protein